MDESEFELSSDDDDNDWIPIASHEPTKNGNCDSDNTDDEEDGFCSKASTVDTEKESQQHQRRLYFMRKTFNGKAHPPQKDYSCYEVSNKKLVSLGIKMWNILLFFQESYLECNCLLCIFRHLQPCVHQCSIFLITLLMIFMKLEHSILICTVLLRLGNHWKQHHVN